MSAIREKLDKMCYLLNGEFCNCPHHTATDMEFGLTHEQSYGSHECGTECGSWEQEVTEES